MLMLRLSVQPTTALNRAAWQCRLGVDSQDQSSETTLEAWLWFVWLPYPPMAGTGFQPVFMDSASEFHSEAAIGEE
jgi:hypothetical protein